MTRSVSQKLFNLTLVLGLASVLAAGTAIAQYGYRSSSRSGATTTSMTATTMMGRAVRLLSCSTGTRGQGITRTRVRS